MHLLSFIMTVLLSNANGNCQKYRGIIPAQVKPF